MLVYTLKRILYVTARGARRQRRLLPARASRARRSPDRRHADRRDRRSSRPKCAQAYGFDRAAAGAVRHLALAACCTAISASRSPRGRPVPSEVSRAVGNSLILASVATLIGFTFGTFFGVRRRLLSRLLGSTRRPRALGLRRQRAALLARHGAGDHLLGAAQLAAADRRRARTVRQLAAGLRAPALHHPAGGHDVGHSDGHHRAHRAGAGRRHPLSQEFVQALRAKGLGEWGVFKHVVKNAAPDGARRHGPAARLPARRLDPDRDRVRLAGHRLPAQRGDLPARPAAAAGHHPRARDVLRRCSTCSSISLQTALDPAHPADADAMTAESPACRRCHAAESPRQSPRLLGQASAIRLSRDPVAHGRAAPSSSLIVLAAIFAPLHRAGRSATRSSMLRRLQPDRLSPAIRSARTSSAATC